MKIPRRDIIIGALLTWAALPVEAVPQTGPSSCFGCGTCCDDCATVKHYSRRSDSRNTARILMVGNYDKTDRYGMDSWYGIVSVAPVGLPISALVARQNLAKHVATAVMAAAGKLIRAAKPVWPVARMTAIPAALRLESSRADHMLTAPSANGASGSRLASCMTRRIRNKLR